MNTKKSIFARFSIALLFLFLLNSVYAQVQTAKYVSMIANSKGYYEYLPEGYNSGTQTYPLMICIGGKTSLGDGSPTSLPNCLGSLPSRQIKNGIFPTSFTVNGQNFKFIVITPQFVQWPTPADMDGVLNYVISHYRVNINRIYLTGYSMGGGVVWDYIGDNSTYAKRIAAAVPISGASYPDMGKCRTITGANTAVWATHNDGDPTVPSIYTVNFISNINQAPAPTPLAKKTIFHNTIHDAWHATYNLNYTENGLNIYQWMLQYQRGSTATTNKAPVANAGAAKTMTLPANSVVLTGTGTDADGTIASYSWSKVSGPTQYAFSNSAAATTSATNLVAGVYTFRLTVKDNSGATATSDVIVTVNSAPVVTTNAPVVNAGMDQTITLPANSVNLSGSATDAGGTIASYTWSKVSGPAGDVITTPGAAKTSVTGLIQGIYYYALTAKDNLGATGKATMKVVVNGITSTSATKYIKVAVYGGADAYAATDWNNWNVGTADATNLTSGTLKYSDGTASAVKTTLSHTGGVGDNGATYGITSSSSMAPAGVLRHMSYSTQSRTLTISGLSTSKKYNVELYASRYSTGNSTIFGVNSSTNTIAVYDNYSTKGLFTSLTPNAQGQITVSIGKVNTYSHLNGFKLTEQGSDYSGVAATKQQSKVMTEQSTAAKVDVYPNPVESQFVLQVSNTYSGTFKVQVINMNGAVQKEYTLSKAAGSTQYYLSASGLSKGSYILKVQMGDNTETKNITKQ